MQFHKSLSDLPNDRKCTQTFRKMNVQAVKDALNLKEMDTGIQNSFRFYCKESVSIQKQYEI